ncbi:acid-activated periplasmic chaperone HdeB [Edwardsiella hoshinae]|nr:acid-activated periplasmic chaperone HdeB [Edwardsiella hoshinae]QPR29865.1 acid-activated periplasmic chaperone HdeB [Edwardsiella hoshinae]
MTRIAILGALAFGSVNLAYAATDTTPQQMTCKEFVNLNPKAMTPVAFWVINKDTDYRGGDYVDWREVETVSLPKVLKVCKQHPQQKLVDLKDDIKPAAKATH